MKKRRFSVEEKIRILREPEHGLTGLEVVHRRNICEQTFYTRPIRRSQRIP